MKVNRKELRRLLENILNEINLNVGDDYNDRPSPIKYQTYPRTGADTTMSSRMNNTSSHAKGEYYEDQNMLEEKEEDSEDINEFSVSGAIAMSPLPLGMKNKKKK